MDNDEPSDFAAIDANIVEEHSSNQEDECQCGTAQCQKLALSNELDTILNPKIIFQSLNQLDRIWPLLTRRQMDVPCYLALLAEYRTERHCGLAWPSSYVAYRCRTCSKALTMALCADCFRNGDHEGHDYNMFKSRSGGACDCGYSIMKESGHCKLHGRNATAKRSQEQIPESIICVPRRSMPRLIHRLAIQLRRSHVDIVGETDIYLDYLCQIANSSAVMRGLMIDAMISEEVYSSQIQLLSNHPDKEVARTINEGLKKLKKERIGLISFKLPQDWGPSPKNINAFCDNSAHTCFIDELIFWVVVFEFPQKLVCFILSFLMDDRYKKVFSRAFVNHYPRIVMTLAGVKGEPRRHLRDSYEQLSRRILQISVQIYNDANLTKTLCEEEHTLHTLIYCLRAAIEGAPSDGLRGVLKFNPLCPNSNSTPKVVCCDNLIIRDRHLGSFTEDLNAILDFDHEAKRLLNDKYLLNTWLEMLSYFQTMSPYKRELTEHTPYETGPHISIFTIEADFCLSPLWSILSHLKHESALPLTQSLLQSIHANISIWLHRMGIGPNSLLDPYYMSFHIPLHRMLAATLRHILFIQNRADQEIYNFLSDNQSIFGTKYGYKSAFGTPIAITIHDFFKILLLHPLQALTLYHETRSSMWTRNGLMTINQAVTYVHCAYCYSTIDLDMFLLKYCASKLNPNYFLKILMSRFHAWKWLSYKSNASNHSRRFNIPPEQIILMIESSLTLIIQLLTLSIHCNISEREQTRQEMIALISVLDRSHSYLVDMLPELRSVTEPNITDENFGLLLDELTIHKPAQHGIGGNLQQGCYTLKPNIWDEEYNPMHVQYRFFQKRDYQMSLERFFQHSKLTGKLEKRNHPSALWPPLKIPRNIGNFGHIDLSPLVECPSLVGIVFSIIYKNLYITDVPDAIITYAIHLLELSLRKCFEKNEREDFVPGNDLKVPKLNPSFTGKFCYKELTSCPAYFGSKGEAYIKGSTIYALFNKQYKESTDNDSTRLFPVVRHALDLAFDTTWFPFNSVIDNCLVHLENVHSLQCKEFEALLKCPLECDEPMNQENQPTKMNNFSTGVSDALMSWCEHDDGGDEEEEDDDDDEDDEDEDDDDDEDDEEENDDDNDDEENVNDQALRITAFSREQGLISPDTDSDSEITELIRQRSLAQRSNNSTAVDENWRLNHGRRTHDRATNTQSYWINADEFQQTGGGNSTTSQNLTPTTYSNTTIQSSSASQRLGSVFFVRQPQMPRRGGGYRSGGRSIWSGEINLRSSQEGEVAAHEYGQEQSEEQQQMAPPPLIAEAMSIENFIDDVEMITVTYEQNTTIEPQSSSNNQDSNSEIMNFDSSTFGMTDNPASVTVRSSVSSQPSPSTSSQTTNMIRPSGAADGDHTYSALETSMEVESLSDTQSNALSLVPIHQNRNELSSQIYPENLVTERRAILASDPRPMITNASQPLALEASSTNSRLRDTSRLQSVSSREERSLSEVDIQARFMGFFQSRLDFHRPSFRGFRQRQMARRGGYRGPVPPFAVHNPNNTQPPLAATNQTRVMYGPTWCARQTARRSTACTLLNRVLLRRSQQDQRARRLRKDRMHHGESLLTLLLRLHAKYSQRARSFKYNEARAQANTDTNRSRIGDGVHFVTIVLDLICTLDRRMRIKLEQLQELIWGDEEESQKQRQNIKCDESEIGMEKNSPDSIDLSQQHHGIETSLSEQLLSDSTKTEAGSSSTTMLTSAERRRRAKEFQNRLMAEFANKQKAFIEKYESSSQRQQTAHSKTRSDKIEVVNLDEEPINLSSKLSREIEPQMSDCDKQQKQQLTQNIDKSVCNEKRLEGAEQSHSAQSEKPLKEGWPIYECCICGVEGPSDLASPLGQVVLLQSTSIYGHSHLRPQSERRLPCEESDYTRLKEETYAKYLEHRIDLLCEHFSESSWLDSINIGAEGGVHVQSCGHYLHIECHQSYIKSLDQEDRLRSRNDSDEFLCPVCRQLANSVLPILSDIRQPGQLSLAIVSSGNLDDQIKLICSLLECRIPPNQKELQSSASFCSHLTKATGPQYRLVRSSASMHSLFLFLTSIVRTNLETEIIVRSTRTKASAPRRSCFKLLFYVLALNAQTLINDQWFTCDQIWSHLTHQIDEKNRLGVKPMNSEVPLLLRDPTAMLLQFLFAITNSLCYRANFSCLVQILFNLTVIQSIALVLSYVKPAFLSDITNESDRDAYIKATTSDFHRLVASVGLNLAPLLAPSTDEPLMNSSVRDCWPRIADISVINGSDSDGDGGCRDCSRTKRLELNDSNKQISFIENRVKLACLPFLRASVFFQHHLYDQAYPNLRIMGDKRLTDKQAIETDFATLIGCLGLETKRIDSDPSRKEETGSILVNSLNWPSAEGNAGKKLIASWSAELLRFGSEFSIAARTLLVCRSLTWFRPSLMQLPRSFDDIFMFYYRKKCSLCHQVPKDVAICLVCGAPICFRVSCCKDRTRSRQVHSQHCGANTAVFLAVHTSSIVVIRGNRACVWGSVYLDAHDEEDSGLQRGKPLYLVQARYELLEEQWLTHSFDHTCGKRWIYLQENQ